LAFGSCLYSEHYVFAQTDQTASKLQAANAAVEQAFNAVLDAEKAGANVTDLLAQLNVAAGIYAEAENSYRTGDSNTAAAQADSVLPIAQTSHRLGSGRQTNRFSFQPKRLLVHHCIYSSWCFRIRFGFVFGLALVQAKSH
jgi:hypothetical protein